MPAAAAVPFLIVVLSIYLLIHIYLLRRLRQAFKHKPRCFCATAQNSQSFLPHCSIRSAVLLPHFCQPISEEQC